MTTGLYKTLVYFITCMLLGANLLFGAGEIVSDRFFLKMRMDAFTAEMRAQPSTVLNLPTVSSTLSAYEDVQVNLAFSLRESAADPYGLRRVLVVEIPAGGNIMEIISRLNESPEVEYAEAMYSRDLFDSQLTPNDPYFSQSWHHPVVETPAAWDIQTGADSIVIAIIDTGVDTDHPDLLDNLWVNPNEIPNNNIDDDLNGHIDDVHGWDFTQNDADVNHEWNWHPYNAEDHGTHCAGIASGVGNNGIGITGASHNSKIMTCKIFPYATDAAAANAIIYAADNGAQVISNSWGGGPSSNTIQSAILHARNVMGAIVLFAAGNDGSSSPHYPGANDGVICVGASNSSDNRASFSNYGSWVDMCAPGTNIWSSVDPANPSHNNSYDAWDGTSMATPLAAGIAALIRSQFPNMSVEDLEMRLLDGDDIGNLQMGLRVNALKALTAFNIGHTPLEDQPDPTNPLAIDAEIFTDGNTELTVQVFYSVSGSVMTSMAMIETAPGDFHATLPEQTGGSIVEYYIRAEDADGNTAFHPLTAPATPHFFLVGGTGFFTTLVNDDAENENNWTMGLPSDDATAGQWVREIPIGTWEGTEPVQTDQDHSTTGEYCFVTGNAAFTGDNAGAADVDGGRTTLLSPLFAIPPGISPVISYWSWYTNELGFSPGTDVWTVEISEGDGTWFVLEQTSSSHNAWRMNRFLLKHYFENPSSIQLRFIAEDANSGSLVEAAIDDLHIFYAGEMAFIPGDVNLDSQINIQDLILLVGHILGNSTLVGNAVFAADFNLDATINIQDVVTLVNAILN